MKQDQFPSGACENGTFPPELWVHIISFLPSPFVPSYLSEDNSNDQSKEFKTQVRNWNQLRETSSSIYNAFKFIVTELDFSKWFYDDMEAIDMSTRSILELPRKRISYEENFQRRLFPKRKELIKFDPIVMNKIMDKQERICKQLKTGFCNGFSKVTKLNLDGWYFLKESELESICEQLKCLENLSIVKCKRIKDLNLDKTPNLNHLRIHVNQIKLRINIEKKTRERAFNFDFVDGLILNFRTLDGLYFTDIYHYCYFIEDMKQLLERRLGVPCEKIRLIFAGKEIMQRRFADYCVCADSTVHVVIRN